MKNYYLFIIIVLFSSCSTSDKDSFFDSYIVFEVDKVPELNISSINRDFTELVFPYNISGKEGGYIFVIEDNRIPEKNNFVHIYNSKTLEYIGAKGVIGFGPNEIPDISLIDTGLNEETFWAYSGIDKKISEFNILDSSPYSIRQFRQPENFFKVIRMVSTIDSTFLGVSVDEPNRLVEFDRNWEKVMGYGEWEPIDSKYEMTNYLYFSLNSGWFIGDEAKRYFVKACVNRDRLEVFDYFTKKFTVIDGPDSKLPTFEIVGPSSNPSLIFDVLNPYRYRDVSITKNFIYALYGGIGEKEFSETGILAKKIYVFSLEGEPIVSLNLDQSLRAITVDETVGEIFGVTTGVNPNIAEFKIPEILIK